MKIKITQLNKNVLGLDKSYTCKDDWGFKREFNAFKVSDISNTRAYVTVYNDSMGLMTVGKKMFFEDGNIKVRFNKHAVKIGEYETIA